MLYIMIFLYFLLIILDKSGVDASNSSTVRRSISAAMGNSENENKGEGKIVHESVCDGDGDEIVFNVEAFKKQAKKIRGLRKIKK